MLYDYPCTFKICWVSPSRALNSIKNLKEEVLLSRFQVVSFHEYIMTKLTTRQLSMDWIVQVISYRAGGRSQDPKLRKIKASREQNTKGTNHNDTPNHEHNPKHNAKFRKDYTTLVSILGGFIYQDWIRHRI